MIDIADFAVGQSRMLYGRSIPSERPQHRMSEQWHPLGVVGVITAFNFPVAVWAWNAMLAAVCGNAIVWKPSPKTPLTAIAVQHLANRIDPGDAASAVFAARRLRSRRHAALAADPRVALVSFTGSSAVGREIATTVAGRFGKCLLECAGNNAARRGGGRRSRPRRSRGAVRRGRHRGPALHDDAALDRSSLAAWPNLTDRLKSGLRAGAHRRPARPVDADGSADRRRRGGKFPPRDRRGARRGRRNRLRRER